MISPILRRVNQAPMVPAAGATGKMRGSAEHENPGVARTRDREQSYAGTKSHVMTQYSVLFISAESAPAEKLERLLRDDEALAVECTRVESLFDGLRAIQDRQFDLVLSELFLPDG